MAPNRSAPPPPPAASSEETGSGSGSDESESEEEIAHSPPPAARKVTAPPPQMGQESEDEDEDEDDDDEEEEDDDDDEEETNHATPPAVPKNPPPLPPNREESESEEEEEEEEETKQAPQPKPAQAEGKGSKPPPPSSSSEDKKPAAPFQRTWSTDDEFRILETLAAHRREHGVLPDLDALVATLAGNLDNADYGRKELQLKLQNLKRVYNRAAKRGEVPSKDRDRRLFDLCKAAWGGGDKPAKSSARREFGEMCELYPYLAEEVRAVEKAHPGLFKREFEMIDDDKARALDAKIKKQRVLQMKLELRRYDLTKEVARALMELVD